MVSGGTLLAISGGQIPIAGNFDSRSATLRGTEDVAMFLFLLRNHDVADDLGPYSVEGGFQFFALNC
jgi:hypothetical protein